MATLFLIVLITAGWWALALWPTGGMGPEWFERARAVCFNLADSGLPDASGWMLLTGQPLGMVGLLVVGWGGLLADGLRKMGGAVPGRLVLGAAVLGLTAGLVATGARIADARAAEATPRLPRGLTPAEQPMLETAVPTVRLVDQHGERLGLQDLAGVPALVTFAFGHCASVCPVVVREAREAAAALRTGGTDVELVVITLDPWRDTPPRLSHLVESWELPEWARVLGGNPAEVEAALDLWNVARQRDPQTGDVAHPPLTYVVDGGGLIRFATTGRSEELVALVRRLER